MPTLRAAAGKQPSTSRSPPPTSRALSADPLQFSYLAAEDALECVQVCHFLALSGMMNRLSLSGISMCTSDAPQRGLQRLLAGALKEARHRCSRSHLMHLQSRILSEVGDQTLVQQQCSDAWQLS